MAVSGAAVNISEIDFAKYHVEYVRFNGHNIAYIDVGKGEDAVVMLHGNPGWSYTFRNLIDVLACKYRVIVPDYLGCGRSDKPSNCNYSLEFHVDYMEQLLLNLGLQKINLIMHGWGGAIGMGFAVRHPDLIRRLVILNSFSFVLTDRFWSLRIMRFPVIGEMLVEHSRFYLNLMRRRLMRKRSESNFFSEFQLAYRTKLDRRTLLAFMRDIPFSPVDASYEAMVEISHGLWMFREMPILIVWGMADRYCSPKSLNVWRSCYPHAECEELAHVGYFLLEDEFVRVSERIYDFLDVNTRP